MGMSQNPIPAEGYVSMISYDQLGGHQQLEASQQHISFQQIQSVEQPQLQQQQQTQIIVLSSTSDGNLTFSDQNKAPVLLVTEIPQAQNFVIPSANILQVPMSGVQQTETIELVDAGNMNVLQIPSTALSIVPNTLFVANNNVYMCLPQEENMSYQISYESATVIPEQPIAELVRESYNQVVEAAAWHLDSDIANRALSALAKFPEYASTNPIAETLNFTTSSTGN